MCSFLHFLFQSTLHGKVSIIDSQYEQFTKTAHPLRMLSFHS